MKHFNELTDLGARALNSLPDSVLCHDRETAGPNGIMVGERPTFKGSLDEYASKLSGEILSALKSNVMDNCYV